MKFKFTKFTFIMAMVMVVMSACKEPVPPTPPGPEPDEPFHGELPPFAMTYEDFITPEDIQIISNDTAIISVSKAYADKMGIEQFKNRAVTIWRTMGTAPFIRIITDVQESDEEIILTTKRGEFCDMFENLDVSLVSDLYVDRSFVPQRGTRSGTDEEYVDVSGKYIDDEGVYHPAVIIFDEDSPTTRFLQEQIRTSRNYFTAEELLEQNATFNILEVHSDFKFDHKYPNEGDDAKDGAAVHLKGKVGVEAKLTAYANVNISWFSLKKFEAGVKGSAGVSAMVSASLQNKIEKKWDQELVPIGGHVMVFWIGPIPVALVYESSINQKTEASATASLDILLSGKYSLEFEQGCLYQKDYGWKDVSKETKVTKAFNFDGIKGSAKVETKTGIFYQMGIYLGGSAGPEFSFGPYLSAEAEVAATALPNNVMKVEASAGAYAGLSGELAAKIKVLGYELAKWSTTFDVFKFTLFEGALTWEFDEESWGTLEQEWTNIMDQGSDEWDLGGL